MPLSRVFQQPSIVGAEAYAWHRELLAQHASRYDPWVKARIEASAEQSAADYIALLNFRQWLKRVVADQAAAFDALVLPTVQIIPPTLASLKDHDHSVQVNQLCLKNTSIANLLDHPAISIPCHDAASAPVGFMLMATRSHDDARLLSIASTLEKIINPSA